MLLSLSVVNTSVDAGSRGALAVGPVSQLPSRPACQLARNVWIGRPGALRRSGFSHRGGILSRWALLAVLAAVTTRAEWQRDAVTLAWKQGDAVIWQFSFDPTKGKPFFNPVTLNGGPSLTNFRPEDHPWHYGLWFSWKYINRVNYWEENRQTGLADGKTGWNPPAIETKPDGSAIIRLDVTYRNPKDKIDLTERRELRVSAPGPDGSYTIDWRAHFIAGPDGAELDRTPLPGEPGGAVNGGYAGLSLRTAGVPLEIAFVSTAGPITEFVSGRHRPSVPAVASNFSRAGVDVGAVAILSDPANAGENPPWYLINQREMRFMCAAILAPKPWKIAAGGQFDLNYRVAFRPTAWTPASLQSAHMEWRKSIRR